MILIISSLAGPINTPDYCPLQSLPHFVYQDRCHSEFYDCVKNQRLEMIALQDILILILVQLTIENNHMGPLKLF